jgi:hypothetical protein
MTVHVNCDECPAESGQRTRWKLCHGCGCNPSAKPSSWLCGAEMTKSPPEGISVGPKDDNLFVWEVLIVGPPGTMLYVRLPLCPGLTVDAPGFGSCSLVADRYPERLPLRVWKVERFRAHTFSTDWSWLSRAWCREGGFFKAELKFPEDFPNSPPEMKFVTPMWHPNSACPGAAGACRTACSSQQMHPSGFSSDTHLPAPNPRPALQSTRTARCASPSCTLREWTGTTLWCVMAWGIPFLRWFSTARVRLHWSRRPRTLPS